MRAVPLPDNLGAEVFRAKNTVHEEPQPMASRLIAVQIDTAGRREEPFHLNQPFTHVTEIRHHIAAAEKRPKSVEYLIVRRIFIGSQSRNAFLRIRPPGPGIVKRFERCGTGAFVCGINFVKLIVLPLGVERRIGVYRLDKAAFPLAHDAQVVSVVEAIQFRNYEHSSYPWLTSLTG